ISQIACVPGSGFTPDPGGRGGTLAVPAAPEDVVCTITNTRTSATLTLQKEWANGVAGDSATLSVNGATAPPGSAQAAVPPGGNGVSPNTAQATVHSGDVVSLVEHSDPANRGSYTSQIQCDRQGLTPSPDGGGGTFAVPASPEAVTCTIINSAPPPALT